MKIGTDTSNVRDFSEEVNNYEGRLEEELRAEGRERMRRKLEEYDRLGSGELVKQGVYRSRGRVKRRVMTRFGNVEVIIHRYRGKDGKDVYPIERYCGIKGITRGAARRAMRTVVERSYGWSSRYLSEESGMEMGRMKLWRLTQEEGAKERKRVEEVQKKIFEQGDDRFQSGEEKGAATPPVIQIDGIMVPSREVVKADSFGKKKMEVKVGVMYRGTKAMRSGGKRRRTIGREVYAEVSEAKDFGERFYGICREHGLSTEEKVYGIGDGAPWIRGILWQMFPGSDYTLDLYHLKENAGRVLVDHQVKEFLSYVYQGRPYRALRYLQTLRPSDTQHEVELNEFIGYIRENISGMYYRSGMVHGSGVVEKIVDIVVKKRMKRQGMVWSRRGANNLLALRTSFINQYEKNRYSAVSQK